MISSVLYGRFPGCAGAASPPAKAKRRNDPGASPAAVHCHKPQGKTRSRRTAPVKAGIVPGAGFRSGEEHESCQGLREKIDSIFTTLENGPGAPDCKMHDRGGRALWNARPRNGHPACGPGRDTGRESDGLGRANRFRAKRRRVLP